MTRREALQRIGTDCMRNGLYEDVWVDALFNHINKLNKLDPGAWHIITDVRFHNEVLAIELKDFPVFRVIRPDNPTPATNHISEIAIDDYFLDVIRNDGTEEDLRNKVYELVDLLMINFENKP